MVSVRFENEDSQIFWSLLDHSATQALTKTKFGESFTELLEHDNGLQSLKDAFAFGPFSKKGEKRSREEATYIRSLSPTLSRNPLASPYASSWMNPSRTTATAAARRATGPSVAEAMAAMVMKQAAARSSSTSGAPKAAQPSEPAGVLAVRQEGRSFGAIAAALGTTAS